MAETLNSEGGGCGADFAAWHIPALFQERSRLLLYAVRTRGRQPAGIGLPGWCECTPRAPPPVGPRPPGVGGGVFGEGLIFAFEDVEGMFAVLARR